MSAELDITEFFNTASPCDYSASQMELGQDAGRITWQAACNDSTDYMLLDTEDKREAFRAHVKDFGAWDEQEIAAWSDTELNALLLQMISGDMRDARLEHGEDLTDADWVEYEKKAERGTCSGRIYRGDDGRVYYYIGT